MSEKDRNSFNISPKKRFGQHFLTDKNILNKIVNSIDLNLDDQVIEFGPGKGALTQYLIDKKLKVFAVEYDKDMIEYLEYQYSNIDQNCFKVIYGDASKFKISQYFPEKEMVVVGNLPYNVSSQIIINLMDQIESVSECYFMVQKEVAQRLVEKPNSKNYSILTVWSDLFFDKKILFDVKPNSFYPPPNVDSSVIKMVKTDRYLKKLKDFNLFKEIIKQAFSQRRKMLRNRFKPYIQYKLDQIVDLKKRGENISVEEYINIANHIFSVKNS